MVNDKNILCSENSYSQYEIIVNTFCFYSYKVTPNIKMNSSGGVLLRFRQHIELINFF